MSCNPGHQARGIGVVCLLASAITLFLSCALPELRPLPETDGNPVLDGGRPDAESAPLDGSLRFSSDSGDGGGHRDGGGDGHRDGDGGGDPPRTPGTLWCDDFEGPDGVDAWQVPGDWTIGQPSGPAPRPHSGANIAGTALDQGHSGASLASLVTPPIKVPTAGFLPRLRFRSWHVFTDGNEGWLRVGEEGQTLERYDVLYGAVAGWSQRMVLLQDYRGKTIQVAFQLRASSTGKADWFIDSLCLEVGPMTMPAEQDFEMGYGDWWVNKGDWHVGAASLEDAPEPYSGAGMAGTGMTSVYPGVSWDSRLFGPFFEVPPNARLSFRYWFDLGAGRRVKVLLRFLDTTNGPPSLTHAEHRGSGRTWNLDVIDLENFHGQTLQLGFLLEGEATEQHPGFFVDAVRLETD
ncbi:MAG: hypothetical protein OXR73_20630 [Myxococcales bacterium]|nr:hypothetical protein [Myxococcales bacterium]